jgi:hypothetical protein
MKQCSLSEPCRSLYNLVDLARHACELRHENSQTTFLAHAYFVASSPGHMTRPNAPRPDGRRVPMATWFEIRWTTILEGAPASIRVAFIRVASGPGRIMIVLYRRTCKSCHACRTRSIHEQTPKESASMGGHTVLPGAARLDSRRTVKASCSPTVDRPRPWRCRPGRVWFGWSTRPKLLAESRPHGYHSACDHPMRSRCAYSSSLRNRGLPAHSNSLPDKTSQGRSRACAMVVH